MILDADEKFQQNRLKVYQLIKHNNGPLAYQFRIISDTGDNNLNQSKVIRFFLMVIKLIMKIKYMNKLLNPF